MTKEEMTWAIVFIKDCVAKVGEKMPFDNRTKEVADELLDKVHKEILSMEDENAVQE